jgi:uncharacterized protein YbaP (TraB family)
MNNMRGKEFRIARTLAFSSRGQGVVKRGQNGGRNPGNGCLMATMIFFIVAAFLFLPSLGHGHDNQPRAANPPFYRITHAGSPDTSYLFGTFHLLEASYVDTMPRLMMALRHADIVVGELVMDSAVDGDALQGLLSSAPLDSLLTKTEYRLVAKAVKKYAPVPMMLLNYAEPIVVYAIIMEGMYAESHPENHKTGVPMDLYFQQVAKDSGKSVLGLERVDDQEQVLDSIPMKEQVDDLMELVRHPKSATAQMNHMLADYHQGKISEILDDPSFGSFSPTEMASMLYDRNRKWLDTLPGILGHHHAFIAVGAGHLAGDEGLVTGLRKMGYEVVELSP